MNYSDYPHYPRRGTNEGCGHVHPRPDGMRMRCGSWRACPVCASDAIDAFAQWITDAVAHGDREEIAAAAELLSAAGRVVRTQRDAASGATVSLIAARESGFSRSGSGIFQPFGSRDPGP